MKKTNIIITIGLFLFLGFIKPVFADDQTASINVQFDVPSLTALGSISLGEGYKMKCAGLGYSIGNTTSTGSDLQIGVVGPFSGDNRNECSIYDFGSKATNQVYFSVYGLPIFFTYAGVKHSCYINQQIGTSYLLTNGHSSYSMLNGRVTSISLPCNGLVKGDTYTVTAGNSDEVLHKWNTGNITIKTQQPDSAMHVYFKAAESTSLSSEYLGKGYKMTCRGKRTKEYPLGYSLTGTFQYPDDNTLLEIGVKGPFDGDNRDDCTLHDNTTQNNNNVYFIVESLPIFYSYKGVPHSCNIAQKVGISYNKKTETPNKLQGESSAVTLPCNGLVTGDTYQVIAGHQNGASNSDYDMGSITINIPVN